MFRSLIRPYLLAVLVAAALLMTLLPSWGQQTPTPRKGPLGIKFVHVPAGKLWAGAKKKTVEVKEFEIGIHEVTQGQWKALLGNNPSQFSRTGKHKGKVKNISDADLKQFPVENVSWNDIAKKFLPKLNEREKGKGWKYRLPTENEWEYACRGGSAKKDKLFDFYFDDTITNDLSSNRANFNGAKPAGKAARGPFLGRPTKVGSYRPNKLGIYDMHGNIAEWTKGQWIWGGSWVDDGESLATYYDQDFEVEDPDPSDRDYCTGFRLVRVPSK